MRSCSAGVAQQNYLTLEVQGFACDFKIDHSVACRDRMRDAKLRGNHRLKLADHGAIVGELTPLVNIGRRGEKLIAITDVRPPYMEGIAKPIKLRT